MANVLVNDLYLSDIADAIREKLNVETTYKPSEMANAIESISGGGGSSLGTKSVTANGTYNASSDSLDGYSQVTVNVPNTYSAGDEGKVVSNGALVAQTSDTVTENGTIDTTLINSLLVAVSGGGSTYQMASGTVTPSADDNSIYVDVDFEPTHAMIFADYANWSYTSWVQWGNVIFDTSYEKYLSLSARVLNGTFGFNAANRDISLISYSGGKFKFYDSSYKFKAGITYHWFCWR